MNEYKLTIDQFYFIYDRKKNYIHDLSILQKEFTFVGKNQEKLNQVIEALSKILQPLQDLEDFLNEVLEAQN